MFKIESDKEKELILAQWQTCIEMADSISGRRDTMNNLFITLNSALITAISSFWDVRSISVSFIGIIVSIFWFLFINNFKRLNEAKFKIVNDMELKLLEQPFTKEFQILKVNGYKEGTKLEKMLPTSFGIFYIAIIVIITI